MAMNDELKKDTNKPKKGISTKQVVLICSGTLLAIAAIVAVCIMMSPFGQYNLGISALNKGNYASAVKHLSSAGAYRDAQVHLVEASNALNYQLAQQSFSAGDYAGAVEKYTLIPGYLDSDDQLVLAQMNYHYQQGDILFSNGDYINAFEEFNQIPDFEDSQEKIFNCGMGLLQAGDYETAAAVFDETDYAGAVGYEQYASGMKNYVDGNLFAAAMYFRDASGVEDSAELLVECSYQCGIDKIERGSYDDARDYFIVASGYEDADEMKLNCDLMLAEEEFRNGNLYTAQTAFRALPSDMEYNGVSVSERLALLEQYSEYVNLCGKWTVTSGRMETVQSGTYYADGWTYEFNPNYDDDFITIRCIINSDGTVTVSGSARYRVFTNYSSVRDFVRASYRTCNFNFDGTSLSGEWQIRNTATLTYRDGAFHIVDIETDTPYSRITETYTTDIYFGSLSDYNRL